MNFRHQRITWHQDKDHPNGFEACLLDEVVGRIWHSSGCGAWLCWTLPDQRVRRAPNVAAARNAIEAAVHSNVDAVVLVAARPNAGRDAVPD
ncbi:hypothetical protein JJB09_25530 [Rhizobium sp. KVB221]|uniref:Uncharacterized protein n=1 Tax=Rhizobium setariae TaxID=2801340 RepID=A0A936YUL4_9HYPH|nr:hypothetical protein [Rhizobium setariae]MBL0375377.1 hypothetical protein [Rhizobium setariae]